MNTNKGSVKKILLIIIVIIIVGAVIAGNYIRAGEGDDAMTLNEFAVLAYKEVRHQGLTDHFPQTIGDYSLKEEPTLGDYECHELSEFEHYAQIGLSGYTCSRHTTAQYNNSANNEVFYVNIFVSDKGEDVFKSVYEATGTPETISGNSMLRLGKRITWFPAKKISMIRIGKATWYTRPDNTETLGEYLPVTGDEKIVQYFLEQHGPKR